MDYLKSRFFKVNDQSIDQLIYELPKNWWSRKYEYAWASSFANKNRTVLDAACGILHPFKFHLNRTCKETFACDWDPRILDNKDILNNIISEIGVEAVTHKDGGVNYESFKGLNLAQSDVAAMPYEDDKFDLVFCISVLEHMNLPTMTKSLSEFKRVLKKDGTIILTFDFPTIDLNDMSESIQKAGLNFLAEVDMKLPEDAVYSDLWGGRLYCFRALLVKDDL